MESNLAHFGNAVLVSRHCISNASCPKKTAKRGDGRPYADATLDCTVVDVSALPPSRQVLALIRVVQSTSVHPRLALLTETLWIAIDDLWHSLVLIVRSHAPPFPDLLSWPA
eukprot:2914814-Rhodomonas_salina.1